MTAQKIQIKKNLGIKIVSLSYQDLKQSLADKLEGLSSARLSFIRYIGMKFILGNKQ